MYCVCVIETILEPRVRYVHKDHEDSKILEHIYRVCVIGQFWKKVLDTCTKTTGILKIWDIYIACALLIQFWNHVLSCIKMPRGGVNRGGSMHCDLLRGVPRMGCFETWRRSRVGGQHRGCVLAPATCCSGGKPPDVATRRLRQDM